MEIIEKNGENIIEIQVFEASCHTSGCPQCDDCRRDFNDCWDYCDQCPPNK